MKDISDKLVAIESPFRGEGYSETEINILYAKACIHDALTKGEFPYASHLFFTQDGILDDKIPEERKLGIDAGIGWANVAKKRVVYTDRGISTGMEYGIKAAKESGVEVEYRTLPNFEDFLEEAERKVSGEDYKFKK